MVEGGLARLPGDDGDDGAQVPGAEPPYVRVRQAVAFALHGAADTVLHVAVGRHVEQDGARVPHQPV